MASKKEIRVIGDLNKAQDILDFTFGKGQTKAIQAIVASTVIIEYFEGYPIRIIQDPNGDVWFVAKDVCDALEIGNSREAIKMLDADEKGVKRIDTPGGMQTLNVISESGRYRLTMRCDKAKAKPFQDWVVKKVLPTIRKTGSYSFPDRSSETSQLVGAVKDLVGLVHELLKDRQKPLSLPAVPDVSYRLKISQLIRKFVAHQSNGYTHQDAFDKLYYEYKYRYHVDLKERAKNSKSTSIMDYAEYTDVKEGTHYVRELYELALVLFPEI